MRLLTLLATAATAAAFHRAAPTGGQRRLRRLHAGVNTSPLTLPCGETTSATFSFSAEACSGLGEQTNDCVRAFRRIKAASEDPDAKRVREESLEYHANVDDDTWVSFECNPNVAPDPMHADVFVKVRSGGLEVTSTCTLVKLIEALTLYTAANVAAA